MEGLSTVLILLFVGSLVAIPLWKWVSNRLGERKTIALSVL
jgi:hypothetical protein